MADVEMGLCTINMSDQFKVEFKRQFFPIHVLYEERCKLRELKQTGNVRVITCSIVIKKHLIMSTGCRKF